MQSTPDSKMPIVGIKIISMLIGFNSLISFFAGVMRFILKDRYPQNEPGWILAGFLVGVAFYFAWLSIGLWKLKNKARIATLVTMALIFILLTANLIQNHIVPNFKSWWHYYLYPVLFLYLVVPPVRKKFTS